MVENPVDSNEAVTANENVFQIHLPLPLCRLRSLSMEKAADIVKLMKFVPPTVSVIHFTAVAAFTRLMNKRQMKLYVLHVLFHLSSFLAD